MKPRQIELAKRLRQRRYEFILAAAITAVALLALVNTTIGRI